MGGRGASSRIKRNNSGSSTAPFTDGFSVIENGKRKIITYGKLQIILYI